MQTNSSTSQLNKNSNYISFYLNGNVVKTLEISNLAPNSTIKQYKRNQEEFTGGLEYDLYIQPAQGEITFDAFAVSPRSNPSYKYDATIIYPEPITKTDKDVLRLSFAYYIKGGQQELDLSGIDISSLK